MVFVSPGSNLTFLFEPTNGFETNNPEEEEDEEGVELKVAWEARQIRCISYGNVGVTQRLCSWCGNSVDLVEV